MATRCYLAMTSAEISSAKSLPPHPAWMACHFDLDSRGLSNLPTSLPADSMIILNDQIPVSDHDPQRIAEQLAECNDRLKPRYFLLDLQRPNQPETASIAAAIVRMLGEKTGVSEYYAKDLPCPVFVSSCPLRVPLETHLKAWSGREIWLEAALEAQTVTVDQKGCRTAPADLQILPEPAFTDDNLCCRYHTQVLNDRVEFSVQRDTAQLQTLLDRAEALGVKLAVGLYQQLGK